MTIAEALNAGTALLQRAGVESPSLDASLFLADLLAVERSRLPLMERAPLAGETGRAFDERLARRAGGTCAAYILGRKEFWGLDFLVGPEVLVPRPETEILVETALHWLTGREAEGLSALDLCTGSGAAAIALKHELPLLEITGSDISPAALKLARENARRLPPPLPGAPPIVFIQSDLFEKMPGRFGLIVSNPPYVESALMDTLPPEVRGEPSLALDGGEDGLGLIRRIIPGAPARLKPGGALFLEAAPGQMKAMTELLEQAGFENIFITKDLAGLDRVIGGNIPAAERP